MRIIPIAPAEPAARAVGAQPALQALPPLALYLHYPWCVRKCPYCDFNSHEFKGDVPEEAYLAALIADLEAALPQIWGRRIVSLFIGGGTPSLISAAGLDQLLTAIRARLPLLPDAEITLEANPGTVEAGKFAAFRASGINRISLGIQSFDDRHLAALGRIHSALEARHAIDLALAHFERVNLDLIYALPQQTLAQARHDIAAAAASGASHVSAYHLTLEPNTPFHHAPPSLPDDDLAADMQDTVEAELAAAGFEHYETSAFARPGQRCLHNLNYWHFGDYLGIGAGAHGKISSPAGIVRETRRKHPREYLDAAAQGDFVQQRSDIGSDQLPVEFMMNALRLCQGFPLRLFEERTGLPVATLTQPLLQAQQRGLLAIADAQVVPTLQGQRFLNDLLQIFFPGEAGNM
ncbi:MAG: oxygen-independent coproporphyrinogen III oxidase-like protein [Betaproteobacteria bacterium]|nr:oxygen-independent coproporphyrinogen III oxidase-like protein [Betaproteobacteria bacterium]